MGYENPSADQAAAAVIAGCLVSQDIAERAVELLTPDDFRESSLSEAWPDVFEAIASLVNKGQRPVPVMVDRELKRLGLGKDLNGKFLNEIMRYHVTGVQVDQYVNVMREYGARRRLRAEGLKLMELAGRDDLTLEQVEAEREAVRAQASSVGVVDKPKRLGDVIAERVQMHRNRKRGESTGLPTGFKAIDRTLLGLQPSDLIILAGRPGAGKTALAENIGVNVACAGNTVVVVSLEMPDVQLADRAIASEGVVDGSMVRAALVEERHWQTVEDNLAKSGIAKANLFVDDCSKTTAQIRRYCLRVKREFGLHLLIIDYLQLMQAGDRYRGNKVAEVSEISASLKGLAKELNIPIIALSQLSRSVEQRQDKRPMLSDLRDSGGIEQDADVVAFVYRDDYYADLEGRASSAPGEAEVIIAKHRNGPTGTANLGFIRERTKFTNLDKRHA